MKPPQNKLFPAWLLLSVLVTGLVYSHATVDANLAPRFVSLSVFAFFLFLIGFVHFQETRIPRGLLVFVFFYAIFLVCSIPGIFLHRVNLPQGVADFSKHILFLFLVAGTALFLQDGDYRSGFARIMCGFGTIACIIGCVQFIDVYSAGAFDHNASYMLRSDFAHKNIFSEVLAWCLPFSIVLLRERKLAWRMLGIISFMSSCLFLVILFSRNAWVGVSSGLLVTGIAYLASGGRRKPLLEFARKNSKLILVAGIILPLAFLLYSASLDVLVKQATSFFRMPFASASDRIIFWKESMRLFFANPWFGTGMGSWSVEIMQFGSHGMWNPDLITFYQHPHNDYVEILAESGLPAFLSYIAAIGYAWIRMAKKISSENIFDAAALWSLTSFLFISAFAFPDDRMEHVLIFSIVISFALSGGRQQSFLLNKQKTRSAMLFILLLLLPIVYFSIQRFNNEKILATAFRQKDRLDWKGMRASLATIDKNILRIDPMSTPVAWYEGTAAYSLGDYQEALKKFMESNQANPWHFHSLNNTGICYELAGQHDSAIAYIQKALELQPLFDEARMNLAAVYFNKKEYEHALDIFAGIPPRINEPGYHQFFKTILPAYINSVKDRFTNEEIKSKFNELQGNYSWYSALFFKSLKNKIPFKKQMEFDLEYTFSQIDKNPYLASEFLKTSL